LTTVPAVWPSLASFNSVGLENSNREQLLSEVQPYKQVHRNLTELDSIGVIEFEGGGPGSAKAPTLAYDGLEIDLPFTASEESVSAASP